ncbi:thrombospondin-1-like [Ruditapes philippinarum]|uniref:thrombospondin-1-like n=1 Tax=Ruditapes philippinarum TaxID=129788 RepID=UPI00295A934A|nr:thrombospondin-1-like [Ruditapes philippinarum]
MHILLLGISLLLHLLQFDHVYTLHCYTCSNIDDVNDCHTVTECLTGQVCYQSKHETGQTRTLGCIDKMKCGVNTSGVASLVGRDVNDKQNQFCQECCSTDKCNKNLCNYPKTNTCVDDEKFDCALLHSVFNTCIVDVSHAKTVCPKYCGLCPVDGNWAAWSLWSSCDVTCSNGTQSRTRTCSNPTPVNHGLNCSGNDSETRKCFEITCPVNGGWTTWSSWEACSVTCGVGLQRRHRNCTNPLPDRFGHHCFGDSLDDKICLPSPCTDGGWTNWGDWSECTLSCGTGIKSRSRNCTHPSPSPFGKYCEGDPLQTVSCNVKVCFLTVAFMARTVQDYSPSVGDVMIFGTTMANEGQAYNNLTGIFTAPVNGIYSFNTQFCLHNNKFLYFAITLDGAPFATSQVYDTTVDRCNSVNGLTYLSANAKVWVKCTTVTGTNVLYQDNGFHINSFSGFLIH